MNTAIITGITGQDGAYLSKLLLEKGYKVIGLTRKLSVSNSYGLEYLRVAKDVKLIECDLLDFTQVISILKKYKPTEIYNLAAQSSVSLSFAQPIGTLQFNINSVLNILEAIRLIDSNIKFYQASSSEMYGKVKNLPITETTQLHPLSPYAISKATAHWSTINYREAYGLFSACGVLFNHESYLRTESFFIKKVITQSIHLSKGNIEALEVGNIDVKRDFGYAPDYVEAIWKMMQCEEAQEFLICSGQSISLREIIYHAFDRLNISQDRLVINPEFYRPTDIEDIYGDPTKAKLKLGWSSRPHFKETMDLLIEEELANWIEG